MNASVIIPQWGNSELTLRCVTSLLAHHSELQVIVVDDGSPPQHVRNLQQARFPHVELVRSPRNTGVTRAWNLGAEHACNQNLIFLNNDVTTHGPWVQLLIDSLSDASPLAGPALRRETGRARQIVEKLGIRELLQGWCLAVRRSTFERLGGFDPRYRLYFSDTDFQLRAVTQLSGEQTRFSPPSLTRVRGLPLQHDGHQTTRRLPERRQHWSMDQAAFLDRWQTAVSVALRLRDQI